MSVDGFRRPARRRPVRAVGAARPEAPVAKPRKNGLSNALAAAIGRSGLIFFAQRLRRQKHKKGFGQKLHEAQRARAMRVAAVTVFSVTFFATLITYMINPPGASATIETGDGLTVYGNSASSSTTPRYRDYFEISDSFGAETNTVSGSTPLAMQIKTSTIKTEAIVGYQNSSGTLQIMCYDGTNWSNDWSVASYGTGVTRAYDIAYETQSGDVIVMYSRNTGTTNELGFRRKDGTKACGAANWDAAVNVDPVRTSGTVNWVTLQNDPNSNTVAAIWADSNRDLSAMVFNGSTHAWGNEPSAAIATNVSYVSSSTLSDTESFDIAYESASSDLMIVVGNGGVTSSGNNLISYKACTGGGASCTWQTTGTIPSQQAQDNANHLDMAANPQTDEIVFGAISNGENLSIGYWDGSSWPTTGSKGLPNADTTTETVTNGRKLATANWMINGATTKSIIIYGDSNSQRVDYFTGVSGVFTVQADYTPTPLPTTTTRYYKSRKDPYHLNRVMLEFQDSNNDLFAKHVVMDSSGALTWTNSDGGAALQANITSSRAGPFAFAYWQNVPTPGPSKIYQDGYIFENDDQVAAGNNQVDGDSVQDVGNTAITGVRQGERITVRFHVRNTGVDPLTGSLGLFYDRNDGYFVKADDHAPPNTATGDCTDNKYNCGVVDNAAGTDTGKFGSLVFDPSGQAWTSYYDTTNTRLVVAKYVGYGGTGCGASGSTAWTCSVVDSAASTDLGQYTSMGFDGSGVPWISYYDATNTNLRVAVLHTDTTTSGSGCGTGSTMWDCTTVDSTANMTGQFTSIAFDQTGKAGVAYTYDNGSTKGFKYANYVGTGGTGCAVTSWTCTVVDSGSATGIDYTSIQFSHANKPWVMYYDKANTALNVATYVGGTNGTGCGAGGSTAWTCTQVDNAADVGSYPNLMFGPAGNAWVSYYDATGTQLKVATFGGSFGTTCNGATAPGWTCGVVDNTGTDTGQYTSLAADASGQVIVSYYDATNTALRVARYVGGSSGSCTSTSWNCGAVDNTGTSTGQHTSAAVAPTGNLWVAYYDPTNTSLRAAQVTRGGEIIPAAGLAGLSPGTITMSQADMTSVTDTANKTDADCLTAGASWNNGVWGSGSEAQSNQTSGTNSILPAGSVAAQCTEVAFTLDTSHATPGATYRLALASSNSDRNDKGVWRGPSGVTYYATFTMASSSITQRFSKDTNPSFPTCDGNSSWGCEALQSTNSVGQYASMAFGPDGRPWVSFYDATNTAMRVAQYVGTGGTGCANTQWTCIQMENQSGRTTGQHSSIAFGKDGTPWVAYRDNSTTSGGLKVAQRVSSSGTCASIGGSATWNCTRIDTGTGLGTGQFTSVAVAPSGAPWIAYYDNGNAYLKVAVYVGANGSGCTGQPSPAWSCFTVDQGGSYGQDAALGFDSSGTAWISYYDNTNGRLRVAQYVGSGGSGCSSTQWTCTEIDSAGNSPTSISFGTNGRPAISYYDGTNSALDYATYVGSGGNCSLSSAWNCTQVDNSGSDGQYSSVAFDATGNPWISYYESGGGDLRIAKYVGSGGNCTSTAWNCFSVNTGNTVGQFTSLAFDHSGDPWVAYYDATNFDVRLAKQSMPTAKPMAQETLPAGPRNARMDDGRYHLDNGLAPRSSTGNCNAVANNMGYCGVITNDGYFDTLYANPNEQPFNIFAVTRSDNTSPTFVLWNGASDIAASTANIKMEVYNISTSQWDTITTNTTCAASSACSLTGSPSGTLSNYYELSGSVYWIYFRVSQAPNTSSSFLFQTNVFMFAPTTDLLMRHGQWFDPTSQQVDRSQPFFWTQI